MRPTRGPNAAFVGKFTRPVGTSTWKPGFGRSFVVSLACSANVRSVTTTGSTPAPCETPGRLNRPTSRSATGSPPGPMPPRSSTLAGIGSVRPPKPSWPMSAPAAGSRPSTGRRGWRAIKGGRCIAIPSAVAQASAEDLRPAAHGLLCGRTDSPRNAGVGLPVGIADGHPATSQGAGRVAMVAGDAGGRRRRVTRPTSDTTKERLQKGLSSASSPAHRVNRGGSR